VAPALPMRLRRRQPADHAVDPDPRRRHVDAERCGHQWSVGGSDVGCGARRRQRSRRDHLPASHPTDVRCCHSSSVDCPRRDSEPERRSSDDAAACSVGDRSRVPRCRGHRLDRCTRSSATTFGSRTPAGGGPTPRRNGQPPGDVDTGPGRPSRRVSARVSASPRVPRGGVCRASASVHGHRRWLFRRSCRLGMAAVALSRRVRRPMARRSASAAPRSIATARTQRRGLVRLSGHPRGHVRHAAAHRPNRSAARPPPPRDRAKFHEFVTPGLLTRANNNTDVTKSGATPRRNRGRGVSSFRRRA
jgi:hypothetical protein